MIEFTPDIETKVPLIDSQHREIFNRINDVVSMGVSSVSREETDKTIRFLNEYVVKHFTDEEEMHRKTNYPKKDTHKELHKLYIKSLQDLTKEYEANGPSASFTLMLNKSIIEWIVKHIKYEDMDFGKFYANK